MKLIRLVFARSFSFPLSLLMAFRNMRTRKTRTALTVLGIVIGVTAIVALTSVSEGMRIQMTEWIKSAMGADLIVTGTGSSEILPESEISEDYTDAISELAGVKSASSQLYCIGLVDEVSCLVQGVESDINLSHITITSGSMFNDEGMDEAVLGQRLASQLNVGVGDHVAISSPARRGGFRVVGVFQAPSLMMGESCILSLEATQELFEVEGQVSSVLVNLWNPEDAGAVKEDIEMLLSGVKVAEQNQVLETIQQGMGILKTFLFMVASISMLVAGIGIMNTMLISVVERRRQIGIMKAIGMSRTQILRVFLTEAILLGATGGLIGCISGVAISQIAESLAAGVFEMPIAVQFSVRTIGLGFFFALTLSSLSGIYPCWRATSYRPVECLRYE